MPARRQYQLSLLGDQPGCRHVERSRTKAPAVSEENMNSLLPLVLHGPTEAYLEMQNVLIYLSEVFLVTPPI